MKFKFAIVNGQRQEPQPGLSGTCPNCGHPMIARCGTKNVWHWSHRGNRVCDPWWENKTEWHRAWQGQFPADWQEIAHQSKDGERHIADVKTPDGWVIEFQHSPLKPEERQSRNAFYEKLVWVVDSTRRKNDAKQFSKAFGHGDWVVAKPPILIRRVPSGECALLREWAGSLAPVFFDFGTEQPLTWLIAGRADGPAYVGPISHASFIEMHRRETPTVRDFSKLVNEFRGLVADYESHLQRQTLKQSSRPLPGFEQHLARMARRRRRF